jgi:DNA polymerase III subunit gamma/tau
MAKALYRKYRSKSLEEVIGQPQVTELLERAILNDRIGHAYLFTGPRGVGKTSVARILAHRINNLPYNEDTPHLDIIEIDAASNNGVDDVRDLREKALIAPAVAQKKVYIIDEVHMLSKSAFNALLKILEEPPEHIIFILATTDFDKLPDTIVSRTQRFHFKLVPEDTLIAHLRFISEQEGIKIDEDALKIIARRGRGSFRDSISLLDQIQHSSESGISAKVVEQMLGLATQNEIKDLFDALLIKDAHAIIQQLSELENRGINPVSIASQLTPLIKDTLATKPELVAKLDKLMDIGKSAHPDIKLLVILLEDINDKKHSPAPLTAAKPVITIPAQKLERKLANQQPVPKKPTNSPPVVKEQAPEVKQDDSAEVTTQSAEVLTPLPENFDWTKLLEYAQQHYTAIYTVLNKCTPELKGDKLILYAGKKFHKNKLDDAKYRPILGKCLEHIGFKGIVIETIGTPPPPKDATAAKIAAMMGGGEEIDV